MSGRPTDDDPAIAITGGKGFVGRAIAAELRRRGHERLAVLGSRDYDLTRSESAAAMFDDLRPSIVIHAAAAVGGIGANVEQPGRFAYENTVMGAHVLEQARRHEVRAVVVIGTICAYPEHAPVPTPERSIEDGPPAEATAAYGAAKRNLWRLGAAYRDQYGLRAIHVIPTNLYGPHDHVDPARSHVVAALLRRMVEAREAGRDEIVIWGDGTATRDLLYVDDAARGVVDALERYDDSRPLNLGTGRETSIAELAERMAEAVGYRGRLVWDPTRPSGAPRRSLDIGRARAELGFEPRVPLDEGLARTVAWYEGERRRV